MPIWILEPHDPLLARDNRPFGSDEGAAARSLPIPNPGTLAGAWRTRVGRGGDGPFQGDPEALKRVAIRGPLLASLEPGGALGFAAPTPADAALFEQTDQAGASTYQVRQLVPIAREDALMDLGSDLLPIGFAGAGTQAKPWKEAPAHWRWEVFERWLVEPRDAGWQKSDGFDGPKAEPRTHVAIRPDTKTAEDGRLFSTEGRRFLSGDKDNPPFRRWALTLDVPYDAGFVPGLSPVGGERRLASWRPAEAPWPRLPDKLVEAIAREGRCRLVLLSPALFAGGNVPGGGLVRAGLTPVVRAIANGRPHVISGWDLTKGSQGAKGTRRAVPAGGVYYLELPGSPEERAAWVRETWLQCVSDVEQDQLDGYGLAALGRWPG